MINIIGARKASVIINEFKPFGLYMIIQCVNGRDYYTGIDNSEGEAWTKEFDNEEDCQAWMLISVGRNEQMRNESWTPRES